MNQKRNSKETIVYMLQQQLLRKRTESCCWQWPSGKELVDSNFPRMNFAGLFNFTSNQNSGFASPRVLRTPPACFSALSPVES